MNLSNEPLRISIDVVDTLFVHALRDGIAQATPPSDAWAHITQAVQGDFALPYTSQAAYVPLAELQPHIYPLKEVIPIEKKWQDIAQNHLIYSRTKSIGGE
ncbi:MAG TPA: hypothetical protein PKZ84_19295 [Anaerolineae bacterium]|nr:hypothetical protein [Anaerolineae bacterium]HQI86779.1 hypothetical protein [Anaerolineae bacterium]